jgi:hypothetical protein
VVSRKTAKNIAQRHLSLIVPVPLRPSCALIFATALVSILVAVCLQLPAAQPDPQDTIIEVPGGKIDVTLPGQLTQPTSKDLLHWIRSAATAVSQYYGNFPVPHLTLRIRVDDRPGVHHGVTYPRDGGLILISVGRNTETDDLDDDWTLTHEMIHLAFPNMPDDQHWIEEGISTYVEPVARAQAGQLSVAAVWKEFVRDMPKGQPADGDQGLDHTHTWGRTYWGGALFCLVADVRIREKTRNRKGLQDALRAIRNSGGNITEDWEIEKTLAVGDKGTGTTVLRDLYREMRDKPSPVDMGALWQKLGVELKDGKVIFNDKAVEAPIRRAITASVR